MKNTILTLVVYFAMGVAAMAQSSNFIGTFINSSSSISIQLKLVGDEYHGMLASAGASFAIQATGSGSKISGFIYGINGPLNFEATLGGTNMKVSAKGYNEPFFKTSDRHSLGGFDLRPYMKDLTSSKGTLFNPQNANTTLTSVTNGNSSLVPLNNQELLNIISGSQLVYYNRTSYVNDSVASSITYVNFCSNGFFNINTDGSYSVEGTNGGNAKGVTNSSSSGTWQLISFEERPAVYLEFYNGETSVNLIDESEVRAGRWRRGNTQYALQRNKVRCN